MQELRLVLIVVGGLAILALLVHGLWSSKKESKPKFGSKATDLDTEAIASDQEYIEDDFEVIRKPKNEPDFGAERSFDNDPLGDPLEEHPVYEDVLEEDLPSVRIDDGPVETGPEAGEIIFSDGDVELVTRPKKTVKAERIEPSDAEVSDELSDDGEANDETSVQEENVESEPEMEVIVLNVHTANDQPFIGTKLFDSMEQNGLKYGEMDIFHRHNDLSGAGKVLFSVANMMQPGTLKHDDRETFTTKGISFFMTLPCYGEAAQNFKLMLQTAQLIANDLGGNVLDEKRNLMTPDRIQKYRDQIREFNSKNS